MEVGVEDGGPGLLGCRQQALADLVYVVEALSGAAVVIDLQVPSESRSRRRLEGYGGGLGDWPHTVGSGIRHGQTPGRCSAMTASRSPVLKA